MCPQTWKPLPYSRPKFSIYTILDLIAILRASSLIVWSNAELFRSMDGKITITRDFGKQEVSLFPKCVPFQTLWDMVVLETINNIFIVTPHRTQPPNMRLHMQWFTDDGQINIPIFHSSVCCHHRLCFGVCVFLWDVFCPTLFQLLCIVRSNTLLLRSYLRPDWWHIFPISDQIGKFHTPISGWNAWKWYPLERHTYLQYIPPPLWLHLWDHWIRICSIHYHDYIIIPFTILAVCSLLATRVDVSGNMIKFLACYVIFISRFNS